MGHQLLQMDENYWNLYFVDICRGGMVAFWKIEEIKVVTCSFKPPIIFLNAYKMTSNALMPMFL